MGRPNMLAVLLDEDEKSNYRHRDHDVYKMLKSRKIN